MKFNSIEHEVIFNKLYEGLKHELNPTLINPAENADTSVFMSDIHKNINVMLQTRENFAYRYISSHRKIVGFLIVFAKKVIRKLLKWYIEPITFQQTAFNNAVTSAIGRTTELETHMLNKTKELEDQYINSIKELEIQKQQFNELNTRLHQKELHYDHLALQIEKLENQMNEKINILENSHKFYSENIDHTLSNVKKLEEIEIFKETKFNIFEKNTYSQSGEDSILAYIIHVLGIPFETITYIDLGANHAKEMSNTYFFYSRGAKGVLVEANPQLIPELQFYRHRDIILNNCVDIETGNSIDFYILSGDGLSTSDYSVAINFCEINPQLKIVDVKSITTISYSNIVEQYLGTAPTILSIDIEGKDLEIMYSIDFENYRPLLIVIEMIKYDTKLSYQTKNEEVKYYLNSKDYDEYAFTGINSIFLDKRFLRERKEL